MSRKVKDVRTTRSTLYATEEQKFCFLIKFSVVYWRISATTNLPTAPVMFGGLSAAPCVSSARNHHALTYLISSREDGQLDVSLTVVAIITTRD